eukprot:jgi/Mesen1/1590/ME000134S00712
MDTMMAGVQPKGEGDNVLPPQGLEVAIDPINIKLIHSLDESGNEEIAEELPADQKLLELLGRIDFSERYKQADARQGGTGEAEGAVGEDQGERASKKRKKKKGGDATAVPEVYPWQGVIEHLVNAQEELRPILDLICQVELAQNVQVLNVSRPKVQLAPEAAAELALKVAVKQKKLLAVGSDLQTSADRMRRQLAHEAQFYGALIRCACAHALTSLTPFLHPSLAPAACPFPVSWEVPLGKTVYEGPRGRGGLSCLSGTECWGGMGRWRGEGSL